MRAAVREGVNDAAMTNDERSARRAARIGPRETHAVAAVDQLVCAADVEQRVIAGARGAGRERSHGTRASSVSRNSAIESTIASDGSTSSSPRVCAP